MESGWARGGLWGQEAWDPRAECLLRLILPAIRRNSNRWTWKMRQQHAESPRVSPPLAQTAFASAPASGLQTEIASLALALLAAGPSAMATLCQLAAGPSAMAALRPISARQVLIRAGE